MKFIGKILKIIIVVMFFIAIDTFIEFVAHKGHVNVKQELIDKTIILAIGLIIYSIYYFLKKKKE